MNSPPRRTVLTPSLAMVAVLLSLVTIACRTANPEALVDKLPRMEATASPGWDEPPSTETLERPNAPSVVELHLDVSYPMAGFLPPPSRRDELSTFHVVTQNVAQHMARVYGRTGGIEIRWRGIGHDLQDLPRSPRIQPNLFNGRSTRLDLSIESVLADFLSGRAEAAALVTDLMATGEGTGVTGPLTVANTLGEWLRTEDVRTGDFHIGLLGVKAEYRGVTHPTECPPGPPLGCWYDERLPGFRRLDSVARMPFYVLVLGRGADAVASVLESLQRGIVELDRNVEAQWELLTRGSLGFETALSCTAKQPQYALSVDDQQQHRCVQDDLVTLSCAFENGFQPVTGHGRWHRILTGSTAGGQTAALQETGGGGSTPVSDQPPEPFDLRVEGRRLQVDLDCDALRGARLPDADLTLRLSVTGAVDDSTADWSVNLWAQQSNGDTTVDNATDWSDWSTELAALEKTMHLDGFVQAVRIQPDRYRVELPAILRFPGS